MTNEAAREVDGITVRPRALTHVAGRRASARCRSARPTAGAEPRGLRLIHLPPLAIMLTAWRQQQGARAAGSAVASPRARRQSRHRWVRVAPPPPFTYVFQIERRDARFSTAPTWPPPPRRCQVLSAAAMRRARRPRSGRRSKRRAGSDSRDGTIEAVGVGVATAPLRQRARRQPTRSMPPARPPPPPQLPSSSVACDATRPTVDVRVGRACGGRMARQAHAEVAHHAGRGDAMAAEWIARTELSVAFADRDAVEAEVEEVIEQRRREEAAAPRMAEGRQPDGGGDGAMLAGRRFVRREASGLSIAKLADAARWDKSRPTFVRLSRRRRRRSSASCAPRRRRAPTLSRPMCSSRLRGRRRRRQSSRMARGLDGRALRLRSS